MHTEDLIPAEEFCVHQHIETTFISSLHESGLVEITTVGSRQFLPVYQLGHVEKLARLHYEMGINIEGIETIAHLLQRMDDMSRQLQHLSNRLRLYENE